MLGAGKVENVPVVAAVQDFDFMGGSLGMAAGEAVITGLMAARERRQPFVLFAASGGARMQEGVLALMQLPRTTVAVDAFRDVKLPYIVVLTHPTTGGVTASYAMLGDVHLAEPGALIGFAGPRVIEQTIREKLPDGFQRAEYLLEHGMVDHGRPPPSAPPDHRARSAGCSAPRADPRRAEPAGDRGRAGLGRSPMERSDAILERLLHLHPREIDLSLERIEVLMADLGHPERRLPPVIHVAGTNGKGSTTAFMRAMLEADGRRVHVYTSPHLVRFHERIRLGSRRRRPLHRRGRAGRRAARGREDQCRPADHAVRDHHRRRLRRLRPPSRPTCSCSRSGSAAGSTRPTSSPSRSPP